MGERRYRKSAAGAGPGHQSQSDAVIGYHAEGPQKESRDRRRRKSPRSNKWESNRNHGVLVANAQLRDRATPEPGLFCKPQNRVPFGSDKSSAGNTEIHEPSSSCNAPSASKKRPRRMRSSFENTNAATCYQQLRAGLCGGLSGARGSTGAAVAAGWDLDGTFHRWDERSRSYRFVCKPFPAIEHRNG